MSQTETPEPRRTQVVVVGLGPVGAAAANLLGRAGIDVIVVERGFEPMDIPRAIHFDASIMRVFQAMGLADEVWQQCRRIDQMETYGAQGQLLASSTSGTGEEGWGAHYNFYQPTLEETLTAALEAYPHVRVLRGAEVTEVAQDDSLVTVRWRSRDGAGAAVADYLLAADGASSTIRKQLGIALDDLDFDEPWLVVDAMVADGHTLPEATSQMFCDPRRPHTLVPGPGAHRRWEFMLLEGEDPEEIAKPERVSELISAHVDPSLVEVIRASVYRFHALIAQRWQVGRIFLLGDAAHQTPPFLGQGMCHGIRDAVALTWRIRAVLDGASPRILDSYQQEREPQVRDIIGRAVLKGREICILDEEAARARDRAVIERSAWSTALDSTMVISVDHGIVHPSRPSGVRPMPQVLESGELLDDALPAGFVVVTPGVRPSGQVTCVWPEVSVGGVPAFAVASALLSSWLQEQGAQYAIVRPDRHAYAFAVDEEDLAHKLAHLNTTLRSEHAAVS